MAHNPTPYTPEYLRNLREGQYNANAAPTTPTFPPPRKEEAALRYDTGKPRYDLIPGDALDDLAKLYDYGAQKYAERNWEKGMSWSRCFGSLMRHAWAFWRGEDIDPESGIHHMTHAAWNCIALVSYSKRKVGLDDRSGK